MSGAKNPKFIMEDVATGGGRAGSLKFIADLMSLPDGTAFDIMTGEIDGPNGTVHGCTVIRYGDEALAFTREQTAILANILDEALQNFGINDDTAIFPDMILHLRQAVARIEQTP